MTLIIQRSTPGIEAEEAVTALPQVWPVVAAGEGSFTRKYLHVARPRHIVEEYLPEIVECGTERID